MALTLISTIGTFEDGLLGLGMTGTPLPGQCSSQLTNWPAKYLAVSSSPVARRIISFQG